MIMNFTLSIFNHGNNFTHLTISRPVNTRLFSLLKPRALPRIGLGLALMWLAAMTAQAANLFTNSSFENGAWGGGQSFVDANNATSLSNSSTTINGWTTNLGSTWVQDSSRVTDANRMLWLGPPSVGTNVCISQKVNLFGSGDPSLQLVANNRYTLTVDYALFDPNDPTAALPGLSTFQVYYLLGTNAGGDDPFSQTFLLNTTDVVSPWSNGLGGSGLDWSQATLSFDLPSTAGYDYMKFFLSAPKATASVQSRGVLIDNSSLALAIPEPGALMLLTALAFQGRRRRR